MAYSRLAKVGKGVAVTAGIAIVGAGGVFRWRNQPQMPPYKLLDLRGRQVLITGATSGIGQATAEELVRQGAHVLVGARDVDRGRALGDTLAASAKASGSNVTILPLDLADPRSVATFAEEVGQHVAANSGPAESSGIHAIVCAAAEIRCSLDRTPNGIDITFATNHLGPQQLLGALLPELKKAASAERHARVVLVGSRLERRGLVDVEMLSNEGVPDGRMLEKFDPMVNYASSKLANMLLATELRKRWEGENIDLLIVSPGMVHTRLWKDFPAWYRGLTYPVRAAFLRSPSDAAEGIVYAVAAEEAEGKLGAYLYDGRPLESSAAAHDEQKAHELFELCTKLSVPT